MRQNVLFDLDGTLLPMNLKQFIDLYLEAFCNRFVPVINLDAQTLVKGIWEGAAAMAKNDGDCLNYDVFWRTLNHVCNKDMRQYEEQFDDFYRNEFIAAKQATSVNPYVKKSVDYLKAHGHKLIVATNPIFPKSATYTRLKWAGLDPNAFDLITVYDNCSRCKPNLNYYENICSICGISPDESIMVGNDIDEDMCAAKLGLDTYLVTDCMINRHDKDISKYKRGSFKDFYAYITA